MSLLDYSAYTIAKKVRSGELSAVAVLDEALSHIEAVDGSPGTLDGDWLTNGELLTDDEKNKVHAFITLTAERARQQAVSIDARVQAGETVGPLSGVPLTIKDIFCVRGIRTTAASRILANFTAPYTASAVERLEAADALTLGKVNLDEFTYGSSTESSAFKPPTFSVFSCIYDRIS